MTSNQIAYWQMQEQKRANRASEANARINADAQAKNALTREAELSETTRHNRVGETETQRHNVKTEQLKGTEIAVKGATDTLGAIGKFFK